MDTKPRADRKAARLFLHSLLAAHVRDDYPPAREAALPDDVRFIDAIRTDDGLRLADQTFFCSSAKPLVLCFHDIKNLVANLLCYACGKRWVLAVNLARYGQVHALRIKNLKQFVIAELDGSDRC